MKLLRLRNRWHGVSRPGLRGHASRAALFRWIEGGGALLVGSRGVSDGGNGCGGAFCAIFNHRDKERGAPWRSPLWLGSVDLAYCLVKVIEVPWSLVTRVLASLSSKTRGEPLTVRVTLVFESAFQVPLMFWPFAP